MVWTRTKNQEKLELNRKYLNKFIRSSVIFIEQPDITSEIPSLYDRDDINLSDTGLDISLLDIR